MKQLCAKSLYVTQNASPHPIEQRANYIADRSFDDIEIALIVSLPIPMH